LQIRAIILFPDQLYFHTFMAIDAMNAFLFNRGRISLGLKKKGMYQSSI